MPLLRNKVAGVLRDAERLISSACRRSRELRLCVVELH